VIRTLKGKAYGIPRVIGSIPRETWPIRDSILWKSKELGEDERPSPLPYVVECGQHRDPNAERWKDGPIWQSQQISTYKEIGSRGRTIECGHKVDARVPRGPRGRCRVRKT